MTEARKLFTGDELLTDFFPELKKSGTKREASPLTPCKRKERVKETNPGYVRNPSQSRAYACARVRRPPMFCSPHEAGEFAADIVVNILCCSWKKNHRLWAAFCLYNNPNDVISLASEYASYKRQGKVSNPVTAFQAKLNKRYPETVAYLVARKRAKEAAALRRAEIAAMSTATISKGGAE